MPNESVTRRTSYCAGADASKLLAESRAARTIYRPVLDDVWSGKQSAAAALGSVKQTVEDVLAGEG